ncbi:Putative flippase GtrA (transmembrane translocase of bactoprenol-linked glucose) [Sinosporangium album]|uniref:Putative flippase GtrA (Transmembrane translocase of bactoprenol-linked glucose) n=1 Tax=Sinosporangium album TaxID=504805 RepID=A0A1G7W2C0_9ACTN|nr:Putative flippase GtrA (transmembrane translocase of bactoprenol-linked glucose) [Sinosporangium album]
MQLLRRAYDQIAHLVHEMAKFGVIGAVAFVIDFSLSNYLRFGLEWGPLISKVVGTVVAATFAYAGNRLWTFRHREQSGLAREYFLFFLLNAIGLLISLLVIGFVTYTLELTDAVSYSAAQLVGLVLGTLFRFWSYRKWVFLAPATAEAGSAPGEPAEIPTPRAPLPNTQPNTWPNTLPNTANGSATNGTVNGTANGGAPHDRATHNSATHNSATHNSATHNSATHNSATHNTAHDRTATRPMGSGMPGATAEQAAASGR